MKKTIIILTILVMVFSGCTTERIIEHHYNETIKEVDKIVYVNVTTPCIRKYILPENKSIKLELDKCNNKTRQQEIIMNYQDAVLYDCLTNNTTERVEDLTRDYDDCFDELRVCEDKLNNISEMI